MPTRRDATSHTHDWKPWTVVVEKGIVFFVFPGRHCAACGAEEVLGGNREEGLGEFYRQFNTSFMAVFEAHRAEIEARARDAGAVCRVAEDPHYAYAPNAERKRDK